MSTLPQRRVVEARFFVAGAQVDEPAFWAAVERLCRRGAKARITAALVTWRLPAEGGAVVARLEREVWA
jgi:hypothetical protein